jgi:DNA-binding transcriptional MerR regulator
MFSIGAFARLAQVSVRTLHHYDEIDLLHPAQVDPRTGYRWYAAEQFARLNRILALRDLGFSLLEVRRIVDEEVTLDQLRGMLRLRQAEATERLAAETERLARVEARLRHIELEDRPGPYDIVVKRLESQRLAALRAKVGQFGNETLGPVFGRLFPELHAHLARLRVAPIGPAVALYTESADDELPIHVVAAIPIGDQTVHGRGIEVIDLPAAPRAAVTIHRGSMRHVDDGYQALLRWTGETGERVEGFGREVYLECDGDPETWITELQLVLQSRSQTGSPASQPPLPTVT